LALVLSCELILQKNENMELKKGIKNKDLEIEAKEAEIHILKKANL
jgi:hypothetical protein